jgi:hypothetical protein
MIQVLRYQQLGDRPIGRTPDSESGYPGSSPGLPAILFSWSKNKLARYRGVRVRPPRRSLHPNFTQTQRKGID